MLTVKVQKSELESGEIPTECMICGEKDATTKVPFLAKILVFPLGLLGILGKILTPKKYQMSVLACDDCKPGFIYEQTMSNIWLSLRLAALLAVLYVVAVAQDETKLLIPVILLIITLVLETLYFWTIGKKNAIRVSSMDEASISLDLPNEKWPAAYTKLRREKETLRHRQRSGAIGPPA